MGKAQKGCRPATDAPVIKVSTIFIHSGAKHFDKTNLSSRPKFSIINYQLSIISKRLD